MIDAPLTFFNDNRDNRDNSKPSSQASVAALDVVACQSKKAANIHNRWLSYRRLRSLRFKE